MKLNNEFIEIFTFGEVAEAGEPKLCHIKTFVDFSVTKEPFIKEKERQSQLEA